MIQRNIVDSVVGSGTEEQSCYYLKLKGDYYRYMCEMVSGELHKNAVESAMRCYQQAEKLNVSYGAPTRLSLTLNMAVFQAEVRNNHSEGIKLIEQAIQDSADKIEEQGEEDFKEAKDIIEIMRDNIDKFKE